MHAEKGVISRYHSNFCPLKVVSVISACIKCELHKLKFPKSCYVGFGSGNHLKPIARSHSHESRLRDARKCKAPCYCREFRIPENICCCLLNVC